MSFSKAKLQRFNDVHEPTSSPADYNPKIQDRVAGTIISQAERFAEQQRSPSHSETLSMRSANNSACFCTPTTVPVKRKPRNTPGSGNKREGTSLFCTARDFEDLQEKIVECNNKDLYIKELMEQLEENKLQISNLRNQNELLVNETEHLLIDHESRLKAVMKEHDGVVKAQENEIKLKQQELVEFRQQQIEEMERLLKNIDDFDVLYKTTIELHNEEVIKHKAEFGDLEKKHEIKIELLQAEHYEQLQNVEIDLLKSITCLQKELETEKDNCARAHVAREKLVELDCQYGHLKVEFDRTLAQLNSTSEQLRREKENRLTCLEQTDADRRAYQATIDETVEALKKQLSDSDRVVERLKSELRSAERTKIEVEGRRDFLSGELGGGGNDDLELQSETAEDNKIKVVQNELSRKIHAYKEIAEESIRKASSKLDENLETFERPSKLRNAEVELLMKQFNELHEYYKNKVAECERKIDEKHIDQSGEYEALLRKYEELEADNSELQKRVSEQESLIGPFRVQLEAYESEFGALKSQKCHAESEAKAIGMKYAQLMGHQNQKQKIKHIVDLKMRNNELCEANEKLQLKVQAQQKIIDKLKREATPLKSSSMQNGAKENRRHAAALNPDLTLSPLRDRN